MPDTSEIAELRDTLQFLVGMDIPAQHKRILIDALTQALRNREAEERRLEDLEKKAGAPWQPHETERIAAALQEKVARSWQHADELLMRLAGELHRGPDDVRRKATELGYGAGVDYRVAKARPREDD